MIRMPCFANIKKGLTRWGGQHPYRGALLQGSLGRYESSLRALLCVAVLLLGCLTWQKVFNLFAEQRHALAGSLLRNPSSTLSLPTPPSINRLAYITDIKADRTESLFHPQQLKADVPITRHAYQKESENASTATPQSAARQTIWQLQVQRPLLSDLSAKAQLANARQQFQAGNFELARQAFQRVLRQDPHQVVALAGMLVLDSQRGELQQRESYLNRLRQEIPDYVPDDDLFLLQVAD